MSMNHLKIQLLDYDKIYCKWKPKKFDESSKYEKMEHKIKLMKGVMKF